MYNKNSLDGMMCPDVYMLSIAGHMDASAPNLIRSAPVSYSLLSLDVLTMSLHTSKDSAIKEHDLQVLLAFAHRFGWKLNLPDLLSCPYTAIVLTNTEQQIQWVNKGFTQMSGYSRKYAVGKKPSFLQGAQTCIQARKRIKENIANRIAFTEKVINYRKNGEPYLCRVNIIPIVDWHGKYTHFIALENEYLFHPL